MPAMTESSPERDALIEAIRSETFEWPTEDREVIADRILARLWEKGVRLTRLEESGVEVRGYRFADGRTDLLVRIDGQEG